jgi:hypothetical protein
VSGLNGETVEKHNTVEIGYNDIGLGNTSPIASGMLWFQLMPHC